jgi:hypothetical protein
MLIDFDKVFHPEEKWQNVKLSDCNPCVHCEVAREYSKYKQQIMMSEGFADDIIAHKCNMCMKHITWRVDCFQKLRWYEDNDERLNSINNEV